MYRRAATVNKLPLFLQPKLAVSQPGDPAELEADGVAEQVLRMPVPGAAVRAYAEHDCDCIKELQFWSHGSSAHTMLIKKSSDRITSSDFEIPDWDKYSRGPTGKDYVNDTPYYQAWRAWFAGLDLRQRGLVRVRYRICATDAEVYYRSCEAFREPRVKSSRKTPPSSGKPR